MAVSSSSHSFNVTRLQDPDLTSYSSSIPTKPPKSKFFFTHFFFSKFVIIILIFLVFSFFPSQAPDFIVKTTIITKLWELFYLLVIGIVVSYGLFSRKRDSVHNNDELAHFNDNIGAKEAYLSGISHISSIFEDGFQNAYQFDDKRVFEKCRSSRFLEFQNSDGNKLNQYFLGESMVIIDDENYVLEQLSKPKSSKENKPLMLPIRSLQSENFDSIAVKSRNRDGVSSVFKDSSSVDDKLITKKFKGLVPVKLEEKFAESDSNSPPLNWHSRSMIIETRDEMCDENVKKTLHFRPLSIGVFDFEDLKNSLNDEFIGEEPNHGYHEPNLNNVHVNSKEFLKDLGKVKGDDVLEREQGSLGLDSNDESSFIKSNYPQVSIGSSSEMNAHSSFRENVENFGLRSPPIVNISTRGKSVRTIRPRERVMDAKEKVKVKIFPTKFVNKPTMDARNGNCNVNIDEARMERVMDAKEEEKVKLFPSRRKFESKPMMDAKNRNFGNVNLDEKQSQRLVEAKEKEKVKLSQSHTKFENDPMMDMKNGNLGNVNFDEKQSQRVVEAKGKANVKLSPNHTKFENNLTMDGTNGDLVNANMNVRQSQQVVEAKEKAKVKHHMKFENNPTMDGENGDLGNFSMNEKQSQRVVKAKEKIQVKLSPNRRKFENNPMMDAKNENVGNVNTNEERSERDVDAKVKVFPSETKKSNKDEEQSLCDDLSDVEPHSGEVDRKADEFIAKFKEQIRLQRTASFRRLNLW